mgnify:CR=1 FL=1
MCSCSSISRHCGCFVTPQMVESCLLMFRCRYQSANMLRRHRCDAPWVAYVLVWSDRTMWWCYSGNCFSFFEHGIFVSAAERCRRKWIFPAGQSSVVCHGFCSRCSGVDAMRHGSRMGFGGQVSICGGDCCDGWRLSLFACLLHVCCMFHASGNGQIFIAGHSCRVPASEPNVWALYAMRHGSCACLHGHVG